MLFKTLFRSQIGGKMSKPVEVGSLKVGGYMVIDDQPCKIVSITKSKPGKHGESIKDKLEVGTEIEYWKILGRIKIVRAK